MRYIVLARLAQSFVCVCVCGAVNRQMSLFPFLGVGVVRSLRARCGNHINTSHAAAFNTEVQEARRVITDLSHDLCRLGRRPNNKPLSVSGGEVASEFGRVGGGLPPGRSPPRKHLILVVFNISPCRRAETAPSSF